MIDITKPLYKQTARAKPQTWRIEISGNKYRTISGVVDGKMTISEYTTCSGKNVGKSNETTPEQQAIKEAEAVYQKQLDKNYYESLEDISQSKFTQPMLAKKWEDELDNVKFPVFSQQKLDGIRCVMSKDRSHSRLGKDILCVPHIRESLNTFFKKYPDAILDGELYSKSLSNDFNKICSLVKQTKPTALDLAQSRSIIQYWIYDLVNLEMPFSNRITFLMSDIPKSPHLEIVNADFCETQEELDSCYEKYLEDGFEGQMIRIPNSLYENKRSKNLLKRKEFKDSEYEIVKVLEGTGNRSNTAGSMILKNTDNSNFQSNIKGTYEFVSELWNRKEELIGKLATVKYFNLTPAGVPRFPYITSIRDYE